ncbi:hypothetical protein EVG20_g10081 [Dentipellis fragilis]|uniref:Uncharacterized protein n=1 Tax=Dentipellis fragilis TaxID=205917 RepID=A0A4Y9XVW9_9AGAM|nr:hypothetical protein EVG20_g10081 [Dentipellis fragilis]
MIATVRRTLVFAPRYLSFVGAAPASTWPMEAPAPFGRRSSLAACSMNGRAQGIRCQCQARDRVTLTAKGSASARMRILSTRMDHLRSAHPALPFMQRVAIDCQMHLWRGDWLEDAQRWLVWPPIHECTRVACGKWFATRAAKGGLRAQKWYNIVYTPDKEVQRSND